MASFDRTSKWLYFLTDDQEEFKRVRRYELATGKMEDVEKAAGFKEKVKLVFVSYGSKELGGDRPNRGGDPKANAEALKAAGINSHFYVSQGTAHEWQSWRRSLREIAPLLFKN